MSKWEKVRLGDVCTINPPKKQIMSLYQDKEISFIPMASVDDNGGINVSYIRPFSDVSTGFSYFLENDVLFAKITPCMENGKGAIARGLFNGLGVGSTEFHVLRPDVKNIISDWVFRYLSIPNIRRIAEESMTGSAGQKRVPKSFLEELLITLPPLEIQKHIAEILDKNQEIIDGHKKQLEELDNLIKATFYDMFGDPHVNEKCWEMVRLGEKINVIGGYAFKSEGYVDEGVPVIKIGNINSGIFTDEGISFWPEESKLAKYKVYPKDIVISLTGTVGKDDYANVCVLPLKYPEYYLNQRNAKLEIIDSLDSRYLQYLLKDREMKHRLTGINRGIRQANISNKDILGLVIPLPPIDHQNKFAEIVTNIEEQKAIVKQSIAEGETLFNSLMSKYFD